MTVTKRATLTGFAVLLLTVSGILGFQGNGIQGNANAEYAIGLWGDLPYSAVQATVGVPNMIADMNSQKLAFTVHDGDLKQGSGSPCNDALYVQSLAYLNALEAPAIFTPGDNDWTDCDRPANGGFRSLERLSQRQVLFNTNRTGQRTFIQEVQATPLCLGEMPDAAHTQFSEPCVENRRWTYGRVTYATMNVQGSCNNLCAPTHTPEFNARNAANIAWMKETFAVAKANGSVAVMLIAQANPGFDLSDSTRTSPRDPKTLIQADLLPDGFQVYLSALRDEVVAFRKPVAYVHGDSHYSRVDRPFQDSLGRRLENFTRVETFGDNASAVTLNNDVQWIKVLVNPASREVFAYQAQIVPANRVAVPAP